MAKQEDLIQRGYLVNAGNAIKIIFVEKPEELTHYGNYYRPSLTHQIFEDESIYGYRDLSIQIFYLAHSLHCYVYITYDKCYTEDGKASIANDDIIKLLKPWFPHFTTNLSDIRDLLAREKRNHMFGTLINVFRHHNYLAQPCNYKITQCDVKEQGFVPFHERFQSLIIMYIDAANFIDLTDEKWMIFYLYNQRTVGRGGSGNYPIGFCTVYKFLGYPNTVRARISQFFIIPPYQRLGLGYKLLDTIYGVLKSMDSVTEITVESPSVVFTRLRDNLDLSQVIQLPEYSADNIVTGYSKAMYKAAHSNLKLSAKQSLRLYHILRYYTSCVKNNGDFEAFKADVIAHLHYDVKKRCHRMTKDTYVLKLLNRDGAHDKPRYLEEKFYSFLREIQASVQYLQVHFGA